MTSTAKEAKPPNFLVIVADDLGYSDIGCFGSEIATPNIDALAREGSRFTDFHTAAACSPTRAMLMSGTDHHLTGLGQLIEFVRYSPAHQNKPGHEGYLLNNVATLPEVLHSAGYHTVMAGKWHLGLTPETAPAARGFERSFAFLPGCGSHYAWEPHLDNTKEMPQALETAMAALHIDGQRYVLRDELPKDFYSTDFYGDKLVQYLKERPKDRPFFAYLPFTAPHWPLQAPQDYIKKYSGYYNDGPMKLRERRLQSLVDKGLLDPKAVPHPIVNIGITDWEAMSDSERAKSARSMEVYAAMVEKIDYNVGKVIAELKAQDEYDNTFILFMSDNGAEGASYEALPISDINSDLLTHVSKYYNNSLENIGNKDSFVWYGCLWAQAATAPARLYKMFNTEGGCRVPLVCKRPEQHKPEICTEFCTVMDIMPTFLDSANVPKPETEFQGREVLSMRGKSWLPFFNGDSELIHESDHITGWELVGHAALRKGHWKINFVASPFGPDRWELYDLSQDVGEVKDLAEQFPDKLRELTKHWEEYAKSSNVVGLQPQFNEIIIRDDMNDPTKWMKYDTSWHITRRLAEAKQQEY